MAKTATQYVCQSCGAVTPRWGGKCDSCGAWNTIVEEARADTTPKGLTAKGGRKIELVDMDRASADDAVRRKSGIAEFDQVTGGGLVRGSAILTGARGQRGSDLEAVAECILRLSQLLVDFPEIKEVDINPLRVFQEKSGCLALDARMVL